MSVSLKDQVYSHLRTKMLSGELGPGSQLSHRAIAKEIGVSFTPVREAINRLATEGLVESKPRMGTFVATCTREELAELYDLREAIEGHAAEKAALAISDADIEAMERCIQAQEAVLERVQARREDVASLQESGVFIRADAEYHLLLLTAAGNKRMLRLISELHVLTHGFTSRCGAVSEQLIRKVVAEHREIVRCLRENKAEGARKALVEHIRNGCWHSLQAYDRARIEEAAGKAAKDRFPEGLYEELTILEGEYHRNIPDGSSGDSASN